MPRLRSLRGAPALWVARRILESAQTRWSDLPPEDRRRLRQIIQTSRGRPANVSADERQELSEIARRFFGRGTR